MYTINYVGRSKLTINDIHRCHTDIKGSWYSLCQQSGAATSNLVKNAGLSSCVRMASDAGLDFRVR